LPTPTRSVLHDLVIEAGESGCLLIVEAQDGSMSADTWHVSPEDAKRDAWMTD
jgi:hypothetical protein